VLAYLDKDVREDLVGAEPTKLTGQTLVAPAALGRDLETVRERGYALEKEEAVLGEGGVAAPIFDRRSEPSAQSASSAHASGVSHAGATRSSARP
jgi:DNA-binding IclR family transcriptional regulator